MLQILATAADAAGYEFSSARYVRARRSQDKNNGVLVVHFNLQKVHRESFCGTFYGDWAEKYDRG